MPEVRATALTPNQDWRCVTPKCGRFHDGHPVLAKDGERRRIQTMRCPECAQRMLDSGKSWWINDKWEAGIPV